MCMVTCFEKTLFNKTESRNTERGIRKNTFTKKRYGMDPKGGTRNRGQAAQQYVCYRLWSYTSPYTPLCNIPRSTSLLGPPTSRTKAEIDILRKWI